MIPMNGFILLSLLLTVGYLGCLVSFLTDYETGKCEMTYMFEYPQFVRISNKVDVDFIKYGLYAYSEGRLTEKARRMQFNGIPVLFVPGSGGSHKQVRSFASIALRKALNSRMPFHFDYFTIDLNKELSGINGAHLDVQTNYVNHCIKRVLELYNHPSDVRSNKSIILIGHSMGGIIVKSVLSTLPTDSDLVPIAIMLSSPLTRPVLNMDYYMNAFYKNLESFQLPNKTTYISIAGGYNDFLVPPYLTIEGHLHLVATCIPKSWVSADHLSVVWCKQLVMAVTKALFDSVDVQTRQIFNSHHQRLAVFEHHLVKNSGIKFQFRDRYNYPVSISNSGDWFESIHRQYSIRLPKGTRDPKWYMLPLIVQPRHEVITVTALNMKDNDWVFICPAISMRGSQKICDIGRHLTHLTEIAPSAKYKRRTLRLNMTEAKIKYPTATHVILRVMPTDEPVVFHIDIHSPRERTVTVQNLPKWYRETIIDMTEEKTVQYELVLPELTQIIQSIVLYMDPLECTGHSHHATASLIVPWNNHDSHGFVTELEKKPIYFRLYRSKPYTVTNKSALIRLTLDPTCRYRISLRSTYHFGNIARFYSPLLISHIIAVLLLTLRSQLRNINNKERCSIFFTAIKEAAKPFYIVTIVKILSKLFSFRETSSAPDWKVLSDENMDFFMLPLLLYLISVGVVWLIALAISICLVFFESTVHKLSLKFLSKTFLRNASWTDHIVKIFEKLPGLVAVVLVTISVSTSGGLAVCLAAVFYFLKLTQMAQDFIEDFVKDILKSIGRKLHIKIMAKLKERWQKNKQVKNITPLPCSEETHVIAYENEDDKIEKVIQSDDLKTEPSTSKCVNNEFKAVEKADTITDSGSEEDSTSEIKIEKPMQFEVTGKYGDDAKKIDGEKLIEMLKDGNRVSNTSSNHHEDIEPCTSTSEESSEKNSESLLGKINFDWLREAMENDEIFFHFTIFMLYLTVACLNIPSVLTWAHNFKYKNQLERDPAIVPGILLSVCALPLWQFKFPRVDLNYYMELSDGVYGVAIVCLMYGSISIYFLSYILSGIIVIITVHQIFASRKSEPLEEGTFTDSSDDSYRNRVKAKLE